MSLNEEQRKHKLIKKYQEYTHSIVRQLMNKFSLPEMLYEEFIAAGYLGLVEAASRFNPKNGSEFSNFAYLRIRGSVIDSIRKNSDLKGEAYKYAKALKSMIEFRTEETILEEMQKGYSNKILSKDKIQSNENGKAELKAKLSKIMHYASIGALSYKLSLSEVEIEEKISSKNSHESPEEKLQIKQENKVLSELIKKLPAKEKLVIEKYYFEDLNFEEIGLLMDGISKSWVSRIHKRALELIKQDLYLKLSSETDV